MGISIIIPTYNRAKLLPRAIRSIPRGVPAEIVIVDDGSTDNTIDVVQGLAKEDKRIIFIPLPTNKGVNYARNRGIEKATGEWIGFLDSDDEYVPGGFDTVREMLETVESGIDIVGFMTSLETREGRGSRGFRAGEQWDVYSPSYESILFKENIQGDIHYWFRRTLFGEGYRFPEFVNGFERALPAKLAKDGKKFLYLNKIVYRALDGGDVHLSSEPHKRWPRQFARAYREFVAEHYEMLSTRPDVLRHFYKHIGKCMLRSYNPLGLWWLAKALYLKPQAGKGKDI